MKCNRCHTRKLLKEIRKEVRQIRFMLSRPSSIRLFVTGETDMAFTFNVQLEDPAITKTPEQWAEIIGGELTVTVAGGEPIVLPTTKEFQEAQPAFVEDTRFIGPQDANVHLSFRYQDNATPVGNWSAAVEADFTLLDTIPPVAPGSIGLNITGEVPD